MATALGIKGLNEETARLIVEATRNGWQVMANPNGRLRWRPPTSSLGVKPFSTSKTLHGRDVLACRTWLRLQQVLPAPPQVAPTPPQEVGMNRGQKAAITRKASRASRKVEFDSFILGAALRDSRTLGTQRGLSELVGVHYSTISGWKTGKSEIVTAPARQAWGKIEEIAMQQLAREERAATPETPEVAPVELIKATPEPEAVEGAEEASDVLAGDIAAVTELIEELVARRVRGAQERIRNLEALLEKEQERCADLRDENELLRKRSEGLQGRMAEVARQAAEVALKEYLR